MINQLHLLASLTIVGVSTAALAGTATIASEHDAMIFATESGSDTGNASGKGPGMFAGADGQQNIKRGLVEFDLSAYSADTLDNVTVSFVLGQVAGSGMGGGYSYTPTISLYTVTTAWNEGNSGATACGGGLCSSMSGTGQGWSYTTCSCGDTSWTYTDYSSSSWTNLGGDYNATADAQNTINTFTLGETNSWYGDSGTNTALYDIVADWMAGTANNYGFEIRSSLEADATSFLGWWTRDGATANMNSALNPTITIVYH
ncbi:MAG TPA: hypothetical protein VGG74_06625 [Kofleriaceae bacterium]|jgi:hypothetical protein